MADQDLRARIPARTTRTEGRGVAVPGAIETTIPPAPHDLPLAIIRRLAGTLAGKGNLMQQASKTAALCGAAVLSFLSGPACADTELAATVVTATRQAQRTSDVLSDVTLISREELARAGQTSVAEILARQPGVEYIASGSAGSVTNVYLRGGANEKHTLVLVDGVRVGSATLGSFSWSRLPADQVERVEILRGPASSLYGSDAIGGVVQIFTRRGEGAPRLNAEVGMGRYDTQSASAGISGAANGWNYSLQASELGTRGFNNRTDAKNLIYGDRDGFQEKSASGSLGYRIAPGHELGLSLFRSLGNSQYDSTSTSQATVSKDYRNLLVVSSYGVWMKNALSADWTSTLRLGKGADDSVNLTNGVLSSAIRTDQTQYAWQNDLKTGFGNLMLALERLDQSLTTTTAYALKNRTIDSIILGWTGRQGRHDWQASVRRDDNSQFGGRTTESLAYGYRINDAWRVHASMGTAFRAPSFNDLYYPLSFGSQGNPNLRPESARNREAGVRYANSVEEISLIAFRNDISDLISWTSVLTPVNIPVNIGHARLSGATLAYSGRWGKVDIQGSWTNQDARDADTNRWIARRARNFATLSAGRDEGKWDWRVEWYGADSRFDNDQNSRVLGGYGLLGVQASLRLGQGWSLFGRVNNLFDKKYELAGDFGTSGVNLFAGLRYAPK